LALTRDVSSRVDAEKALEVATAAAKKSNEVSVFVCVCRCGLFLSIVLTGRVFVVRCLLFVDAEKALLVILLHSSQFYAF
jgi:hypothetical protein